MASRQELVLFSFFSLAEFIGSFYFLKLAFDGGLIDGSIEIIFAGFLFWGAIITLFIVFVEILESFFESHLKRVVK